MTAETTRRAAILATLSAFARQRPGLEFANYGDVTAYRSEAASIARDLHHARELLAFVGARPSITADMIAEAASGTRLTITERADGKIAIDYCVGQYWPTEYRRAVCGVLASAVWAWLRASIPAEIENKGDAIRKAARREFSRAVASRFFR